MAIEPLKIITKWFRNNAVEPEDLSEIADKTTAWSTRVDNNLKQVGLDINEDTYIFNNNGVRTQTNGMVGRITALEAGASVGPRNLGISVATSTTVSLTGADGTALSSSNQGKVSVNSASTAGQLIERTISANVDIILSGADWGFGADLTDYPLWLVFLDDGTSINFGVMARAGLETVTTGNIKIVASDVTAIGMILTTAAPVATCNIMYWGWVKSAFDVTGGASEKLWTLQSGDGDVFFEPINTKFYGEVFF